MLTPNILAFNLASEPKQKELFSHVILGIGFKWLAIAQTLTVTTHDIDVVLYCFLMHFLLTLLSWIFKILCKVRAILLFYRGGYKCSESEMTCSGSHSQEYLNFALGWSDLKAT